MEHPNLATIATAQSRFRPSHFVEVVFHDWNSYFAEFFKIDFPYNWQKMRDRLYQSRLMKGIFILNILLIWCELVQ